MIVQADSLVGNAREHISILLTGFVAGGTAMRVFRDTIQYAISTYPEPQTVKGRWFLGIMKFIVGEIKQLAPQSQQDTKAIAAGGGQ